MEQGWSLKQLHRLIVTSATYRQSSRRDARSWLARDPYNRLLARGPRFRVEAEIVRDIALAASGLLDARIGGPSVFPPLPASLSSRRPATARKSGRRTLGPTAIAGRCTRSAIARCPIPRCKPSTHPTATSPASAVALQHAVAGADDAERAAVPRVRPRVGWQDPTRGGDRWGTIGASLPSVREPKAG